MSAISRLGFPVAMLLLALAAVALSGCATTRSATKAPPGHTERGLASWYGPGFHGRRAANGEVYDMHDLTAAHRTLPFDTVVEVRNRDNGRHVTVRINDRGPFVKGRVIDLSYEAARQLEMIGPGVARVELRVVRMGASTAYARAYWVQAGAFRDPGEAQRFLRRLKRRFDRAQLTTDDGWHRVRIGPFPKRSRADATLHELERLGIDGFVVRL